MTNEELCVWGDFGTLSQMLMTRNDLVEECLDEWQISLLWMINRNENYESENSSLPEGQRRRLRRLCQVSSFSQKKSRICEASST